MKRNDLLATTLVLAVALSIGPVLRGAEPAPKASSACTECCKDAAKATAMKASKEKLVHELVAILNDTKSADTFIVTTSALGMMGRDARMAAPSIIRNAERLGLLKDVSEFAGEECCEETKPSKQRRIAEGIMDCLDQVLSKQPGGTAKPPCPMNATPPIQMLCPPAGVFVPGNIPCPTCTPPPPPPQTAPASPPRSNNSTSDASQFFNFFVGFTR